MSPSHIKHSVFIAASALVALSFAVTAIVGMAGQADMEARPVEAKAPDFETAGLQPRVDALIRAAIRNRAFPAAAVAIGRRDSTLLLRGYGHYTYEDTQEVTPQSLFDLASLTKVIATTTAAMKLYEAGQLDIDAPVARYLPEFARRDRNTITIRHLLTHSAGLVAFRPYHTLGLRSREEVVKAILAEPLSYRPGTKTVYSDHGLILLGLVIEQITEEDFATWTYNNIFAPLGMRATGFRFKGTDSTVVPTEYDGILRRRIVQGEVHDETAYLLGGTAGHAGLFSTAEDLARFGQMLLGEGWANGVQFLRPETVRLFTARARNLGPKNTRALGWDTKAPEGYTTAGTRFGSNSYGHTGFTGTSLWVDPDAGLFVVLLSNRVYPTRENNKIRDVRPALADIAFEELGAASPSRQLRRRAARGR